MKKIVIALVLLAVAGTVAFFAFSNPLGRLVKIAIEGFGPDMLQAEVRVSAVNISTTDGQGKLTGLRLGNPKGFKTDHALQADTIEIVIEPKSVAEDVVVLHKVLIEAPGIIYEKGDNGSNFDVIQRNVESYLGGGGQKEKGGKGSGRKMIVDSFVIRGARVNYNGMVDVTLPDIELRNVGRKTGGATGAQLAQAIIAELNAKLMLSLAKSALITGVGGPAVGAGMAIKSLLGK